MASASADERGMNIWRESRQLGTGGTQAGASLGNSCVCGLWVPLARSPNFHVFSGGTESGRRVSGGSPDVAGVQKPRYNGDLRV